MASGSICIKRLKVRINWKSFLKTVGIKEGDGSLKIYIPLILLRMMTIVVAVVYGTHL